MDKKIARIGISMIAVLFAIAFAASPASAIGEAVVLNGYGHDVGGNPAYFDGVNITVQGIEYNDSAASPIQVILYQNVYQLTLTNGTTIDPSDLVALYAVNGTMTNTTSYTWDGVDLAPRQNITFTAAIPDLEVDTILPNPPCASGGDFFLFGNQSNDICAKIENTGGADAGAFNVSIEAGSFYQEVNVSRLNASENITVCVTDPTLRDAGVSVIINVTADCNGVVSPEISELNNASNVTEVVVNNGYKGKSYTGGSNITTEQTHIGLQGELLYSVGDSYYQGSYYAVDRHWTTYTANWASCDFCSIPPAATIEKAKLYVYYNWDKQNVVPNHVSLTFNGNTETADAFYSDMKGYGSYASNAYHMQAYEVTANFTPCVPNTAVLTNSYPGGGNVSIDGMLLVVIYNDATMQSQTIWLNEECDILMNKSYTCAGEDATAYANFTNVPVGPDKSAKLIAVAPSAKDGVDKNMLTFNGEEWNGAWDHFVGSTEIGIADVDIDTSTYPLVSESWATFSDSGDGFRATNAILLVSDAPYPRITTPSDGDTISGTVWVNETGPDDAVYNLFEYYYDEDCNCCKDDGNSWVEIGNDTIGTDGWGVLWDTTLLTTGCYVVRATMGDSDGYIGTDEICVNAGTPVVIAVEPDRKLTPPQKQFDVNITLDPKGRGIFGVQYTLKYNNSILKAESQVTRDFFGGNNTIVVRNEIDQANGLIHYAETLRNDTSAPCIEAKGTLTTIQFTAIGEPGASSILNFSDVIVVDCDKDKIDSILDNGTVDIFDYTAHVPEITCANSTHEKNNVQKKFECWTELAVNITDGGEEGYNITYVRWSFGDGQYGTAEGGLPCDPTQKTCCINKSHSYISWNYNPAGDSEMPRPDHNGETHYVKYDPFNASVTVTDDGIVPQETTMFFDVWVFLTGDANGDAKVDILDAVWIGKHFGDACDGPAATGATHCAGNCGYMWSSNQKSGADLNNDCVINILDAVIVGTMWGHTAY